MAGKSRSGKSWKDGYSAYKASGKYEKNRTRKLEKHKADHPNDLVAAKATVKYRRKKPNAKSGWVTGKVMFSMMDWVGRDGKGNTGFSGQHSKESQRAIAQYMRMSKKIANRLSYEPKDIRNRRMQEQRAAEASKQKFKN